MIGMFFNNLDMLFFIDKSMNFSYFYPSIYSIFIFYIYKLFYILNNRHRKKYYIYAIKWSVATHYTLDEIRAKKLYDRRVVTKEDFKNHVYEYK